MFGGGILGQMSSRRRHSVAEGHAVASLAAKGKQLHDLEATAQQKADSL